MKSNKVVSMETNEAIYEDIESKKDNDNSNEKNTMGEMGISEDMYLKQKGEEPDMVKSMSF